MKIVLASILFTATVLTGCTQGREHQGIRPDPLASRRMITGSHVPQPVDRPTFSPTSATVPLESFTRDRPGLTPTEPIVGAGDQSKYRLNEPSTGAGPAGSNPLPSGDQPDPR